MEYAEYLKSEHWIEFRRQARLANPRCFCCRSRRIEIHHVSYGRLGCELLEDVVALCRYCHEGVHELVARGEPLETAHVVLKAKKMPQAGTPTSDSAKKARAWEFENDARRRRQANDRHRKRRARARKK